MVQGVLIKALSEQTKIIQNSTQPSLNSLSVLKVYMIMHNICIYLLSHTFLFIPVAPTNWK